MTDKETFDSSIGLFTDRIRNVLSGKNDIVVALSRKGPRLLEALFKQEELYGKVISEHALPFLFYRLWVNTGINCNIYIVDDAIYYGSTVKALVDEIQEYIRQLQLENRVVLKGVITVIKDSNSMDISVYGQKPFANDKVRGGYSHYFVKQVMSLIRSTGIPLEIEFPILRYKLVKDTDVNSIYESLKPAYRYGSVGMITENEGIKSVNLSLSDADDIVLRKLRLYVKNGELLISVIAPELVPSDFRQMAYAAFGNARSRLTSLWKGLYHHLRLIYDIIQKKGGSTRNIERTAVILINFLSSIDTYCFEKWKIEKCLSEYIGIDPEAWIDEVNVDYLTAHYLKETVICEIEKFINSKEHSLFPTNGRIESSVDIVRESVTMTESDKNSLVKANMAGVYQSKSVEEALSVMMFNQMIMVEKMSRFKVVADFHNRLSFGYSYYSIVDFLHRYASGLRGEEIYGERVHEWLDSQIDNGCIVPQYIVDSNNNHWTRVFRPGENEDVMLSHMGRFVAFVINCMYRTDEERSVGKVLKDNLNGILTYVYLKMNGELKAEEPSFKFNVSNKHFLYFNDKQESLVDFLVRMSVISIEDGVKVSLNNRIQKNEFSEYTTLTDELNDKIRSAVKQIVDRLPQNKLQSAYLYPNTINYFLLDFADKNDFLNAIEKVGRFAIEKIDVIASLLENVKYDIDKAKQNVMYVVQVYSSRLVQYELKPDDLKSILLANHPLGEEVKRARRLLYALNLLLITVYKHLSIMQYLRRQASMNMKDILMYSDLNEDLAKASNDTQPDLAKLNAIKHYISKYVLI